VLEGANPKPVIIASDPTGTTFNFYHSPVKTNRVEAVKAFNIVTYRDIYPGIDLVFTSPDANEEAMLHYDFIVHPGADPAKIHLKYSGASDMHVNANGSLLLNTQVGFVEEGKPFTFGQSDKREIFSAYHLVKNHLTFDIGNYDRSQALVIDPTLVWGTYYGGEQVDEVAHIALDSKSKVLISGNTLSTMYIATTGAYQTVYGGNPADLYVAKFKGDGKLDWASYFGGTSQDLGYGIAVDQSDNIILIGKSKSDGLATTGQIARAGSGDAIIVKFSPTGIFQWSTYKGGAGDDHFRNCICDKQGNIYLAGYTESSSGITTTGAFQTIYGGEGDCMISKYSPTGAQKWCTYFGALGSDRFHAINLDLFNHVLTQGTTGSTSDMTTPGVHQEIYGGGEEDVLLAEFDTAGQRIWSTYYGGEFSDRGRGVESDNSGNIYIGGLTESEIGIATPGAYQEKWSEGYYDDGLRAEDGYLAKFTKAGKLTWGTYYGASGFDRIWGIAIDRKAHFIYAVGGTISQDSIATPGGWQPEPGGGPAGAGDGFFSKWDFSGNLVWGSYLGGSANDHMEDVDVDKNGFIYILGQTDKSRMPSTAGVHQTTGNGDDDAVLYKFHPGTSCYDYNEPNNTFNTAKLLTTWTQADTLIYGYNGSIGNATDQDWFSIKIKAGQQNLLVVLSDLTHDYNLELYNAQQLLVQASSHTGTVNDTLVVNNLAIGTYSVRISHLNTEYDTVNCYRLRTLASAYEFKLPYAANRFSSEQAGTVTMNVFPNPATEILSLSITSGIPVKSSIVISDLAGRIVKSQEYFLQAGFQAIEIHVADLPPGMYNMVLKNNENSWITSFIKQ
jgi:hypothetical protein